MLKVMTLIGTRPELIKMCRVISELDKQFEHILVHSGQNYDYELNQIFFEQLEIRQPDHFLGVAKGTPAEAIADVIAKTDRVLAQEQPDALLIYGDTNTGMAVIAAKRRKIPVFHMEAGNRCFDQRVPEELNRKVIDHLSDINMVLTEHARRYLLAEGIRPETIMKTGSHMQEVLGYYQTQIEQSDILSELSIRPQQFFLVSAHREENVDDEKKLEQLLDTLRLMESRYQQDIIVTTHPRTRERLGHLEKFTTLTSKIRFMPPFGFLDYIKLQQSSSCVISDSGTLTEEAALIGFPAIMIRDCHERPEGMDEGVVVMVPITAVDIVENIDRIMAHKQAEKKLSLQIPNDYYGGTVSKKVATIVASYTRYINRTVWHK